MERIRTGIRVCNLCISVARIVRLRYPFIPVELLAYLTLSRGHDDSDDDYDGKKRARGGPLNISRAFAKY